MIPTIESRPSRVSLLLFLLMLAAGAASLALRDLLSSKSLGEPLVRDLSVVRPAGARLFDNSSSGPRAVDDGYKSRVAKAQMAVLSMPESDTRQRIQSLIHIGTGNWRKAADILTNLAAAAPRDPGILNDLGAVYLALAEQNAIYYFKALQLFESAKEA